LIIINNCFGLVGGDGNFRGNVFIAVGSACSTGGGERVFAGQLFAEVGCEECVDLGGSHYGVSAGDEEELEVTEFGVEVAGCGEDFYITFIEEFGAVTG